MILGERMQIKYQLKKGKAYLYLKYEDTEWNKIQKKFEDLGLQEKESVQGFGRGVSVKFYKDTEGVVDDYLDKTLENYFGVSVINDINSSVMAKGSYFNLAPLRVIPDDKGIVELPMTSLATASEINTYTQLIVNSIQALMNIAKTATINVEFEEA